MDDYARALQQEIRSVQAETGQGLTFAQAQALQIPQRVLSQLITSTAITNEARNLGVSVGDETVARELMGISAFQGGRRQL